MLFTFTYFLGRIHFQHSAKSGQDLAPVILHIVGLCQQEGVSQEPSRGKLPWRRWSLERVPKRRDNPSGLRYGHKERGAHVLTLKVLLNVVLLYLLPHLDHSVPFSPVPQKAHNIPIHT